jgi:hypothetical protein
VSGPGVDPTAIDVQPYSAVEDPATPAADLGDRSLPAKCSQVVRVETFPIVQCEVETAVIGEYQTLRGSIFGQRETESVERILGL